MSDRVSVILTIRDDRNGCDETLRSLANQSRAPDEVVVVDGGRTGGMPPLPPGLDGRVRIVSAPGCNIARGRNIATAAASHELIACIDAGCRAEPDWLKNLTARFAESESVEFVAGFYRVTPHSLLEQVVGLCTMRGQLEPVDPRTFNPSGRSMAYRKSLWQRVGGWPEWLQFSEDTLFDRKIRRFGAEWRFAGDAVVSWRPRTTIRSVAKQFYGYGTGRGHTHLEAAAQFYNLRNFSLVVLGGMACAVTAWALPILAGLLGYFYIWTFHRKALRVTRATGRWTAYPLAMFVIWVVMFSHLAGFLVGWRQRLSDPERFVRRIVEYVGPNEAERVTG